MSPSVCPATNANHEWIPDTWQAKTGYQGVAIRWAIEQMRCRQCFATKRLRDPDLPR